jgi:hypothetical protein
MGDGAHRAFAVIVDSSRSMFGESYTRAKKLAARLARELDPSDRIVVLACDSECTTAPDGLLEPGADAETRALAFLNAIEADGASDPTRAVEAAWRALGSRGSRDGRVVYIGDAVPTMGPIRPAEIERAVERALPKDSAQLTAVGVGIESDSEILSALARGGGGVVVPYAPGARLTAAARDVLGAAYGRALRDVEVELPQGLYAAAPARLDAIPAGGELLLAARMTGREVSGDVVLKGRVRGERFERRYPVRLHASSSEGNAFVPRQYAALKIRDLERKGDDEAKRQGIALSTTFSVASRYTSLLVLESQAMFQAFGLDNTRRAPSWSGEETAQEESVDAEGALAEPMPPGRLGAGAGPMDSLSGSFRDDARARESEGFASPPPAPVAAAPKAESGAAAKRRSNMVLDEWEPRTERPYVPMRRVWERYSPASSSAPNAWSSAGWDAIRSTPTRSRRGLIWRRVAASGSGRYGCSGA